MTVAAVVTAAGSGTRLGRGVPKALVPIAGTPMLAWAVSGAAAVAGRIIVTAPAEAIDDFRQAVAGASDTGTQVWNGYGSPDGLAGPSWRRVDDLSTTVSSPASGASPRSRVV